MMEPRKGAKRPHMYKCERCHYRRGSHGEDGSCPDGKGVFAQRTHRRLSASQSFTPDEVRALEHVLATMRNGGRAVDMSVLARSPAIQSLARKAQGMKERIEAEKAARDVGGRS